MIIEEDANASTAETTTPAEMLGVSDILRALALDKAARSVLNRFLERPPVRAWLGGAITHPRYPAASLPCFAWMMEQSEKGIGPKAMAVAVADLEPLAVPGDPGSGNGTSVVRNSENGNGAGNGSSSTALQLSDPNDMARAAEMLASAFVRQVREASLLPTAPPLDDRLLDREEAAALLRCEPRGVGRRVPPVRQGFWSYLMIQKHLAGLRDQAEAKAEQKRAAREARKSAPPLEAEAA